MEKIVLFSIFALILLSTNTLAYTEKYCLDNQTLRTVDTKEMCDNKGCENITINQNIKCDYGCNLKSNDCYMNPILRWIIAGSIFFIVLYALYKVVR